jgi:hypothetical protein
MKTINFDYTGGFPLEQPVLKRMQSATLLVLEALVKQLGCADAGNYILSGCIISGANITPGIMYIDGELCPFAGAVGDATTKIKKQTNTLTAPFENGTNPPVFIETVAVVNAAGTELQNFSRFFYVQDANYVHTDINFTAALLAKLNGIESGAEVNVQADWNVVNPLSDSFIKNKPTFLEALYKNSVIIGDITNNDFTVSFPSVGTSNYSVFVSFEAPVSNAGQSASYIYVVHSKTDVSFKVRMNETGNNTQSLTMNYLIIEN